MKEVQKLRWTLSRVKTSPPLPYPDLSSACSRLVTVLVARGLGYNPDLAPGEDSLAKLGLRQRLARWGYYHGRRQTMEFFREYS